MKKKRALCLQNKLLQKYSQGRGFNHQKLRNNTQETYNWTWSLAKGHWVSREPWLEVTFPWGLSWWPPWLLPDVSDSRAVVPFCPTSWAWETGTEGVGCSLFGFALEGKELFKGSKHVHKVTRRSPPLIKIKLSVIFKPKCLTVPCSHYLWKCFSQSSLSPMSHTLCFDKCLL